MSPSVILPASSSTIGWVVKTLEVPVAAVVDGATLPAAGRSFDWRICDPLAEGLEPVVEEPALCCSNA